MLTTLTTLEIVIRIFVAIGLGTLLGLERTLAGKGAGMRTYAMVTLGSSLFVVISDTVLSTFSNPVAANPLLVMSSVITGIGFIGAGIVLFQGNKIVGLTTAAGLWVAAGVGIACGFGLFNIAMIATIGALAVFTAMWFLETGIFKRFSYKSEEPCDDKNKI